MHTPQNWHLPLRYCLVLTLAKNTKNNNVMLWPFIPIGISLISFAALIGVLHLWHWIDKRRNRRRTPLTQGLLRGPGESLRKQIDNLTLDLMSYVAVIPTLPLLLYASYLTHAFFGAKITLFTAALYIVCAVVAIGYSAYKTVSTVRRRRKLILGMEAEIAVGQELSQLIRYGCYVFHDVPAEGFNIDRVVVGPNGVTAVETKGRTKRIGPDARAEARLIYDGKKLRFPDHVETEPLKQAVAQAAWLRNWLSSAVGEPVPVRAALAIPGWFIALERKESGPVYVFNGKNPRQLLSRDHQPTLDERLIQRIAHQLDQRCRDIEPQAYARPKPSLAT